jgi:hypothetical protein
MKTASVPKEFVSLQGFMPVNCARAVHESKVFSALGLAFDRKPNPPNCCKRWDLGLTSVVVGTDSSALQTGGRRFDPDHIQ